MVRLVYLGHYPKLRTLRVTWAIRGDDYVSEDVYGQRAVALREALAGLIFAESEAT